MLQPGLSADEAAASQQRVRVSETLFSKDPLTSVISSSSSVPHLKNSRSSTLTSTEENLSTTTAAAAYPVSPPTGVSYRVSSEREFSRTLQGINAEPINSVSCVAVGGKAQQQQDDAAASPPVSGDPGGTLSPPDSLRALSLVASEAHTASPPLVATFDSSAACERFSTSTTEPGGAVSSAYRTDLLTPASLQCNPPSPDSAGERSSYTSPRESGTGTVGGQAAAAALLACSSSAASTVLDSFPHANATAAAHAKQASPSAAQRTLAADAVQGDEGRSTSPRKTEACSANANRSEEQHGAAAVGTSASTSPRKQKAGDPRRGRNLKAEDPVEVIMRLDVATEALVAHAEQQAEQIKKLTVLVEDLSLKLEALQEGLLSGRISVHLAPPPAAELPPAAGPPEVRQSRGRMVPPPLPRDRVREPHPGAADQQGFPPYLRHGNSGISERTAISASYLVAQREAENEALERRRAEEQREAQRREEERLRREEEERRRREELTRRAAEEQRRREALDEKRKNIISSLISNKGGSSLFGDDGGAASHRSLFDD